MLLAAVAFVLLPQSPTFVETMPPPRDLAALLREEPACVAVLDRMKEHRVQILLGEPVINDKNTIQLRRSQLGDAGQYFYPASSIKLCGAIALLLALNEHNRAHGTALGLQSKLVIEPRFDGDVRIDADASNVVDGSLTVAHLLRKLLIVSDNVAYNHCYEVCGQDGINRAMWDAGFRSVRLWHRLSESRTPAENAVTRGVRIDDVVFAPRDAAAKLENDRWTELDVGTGYLAGGKNVEQPMSFAQKNAIALRDLQDVLVELMFPEVVTGSRGFPGLTTAQRSFLVRTLGELPRESANPKYDPVAVPDHACKFVLRGVRDVVPAAHLRVFDKIGRAYGFSVENAWIEDTRTGRGCFLAIALYTNPDGVLNDDDYAYETLAEPFLDGVGRAIARAVFGASAR